MFHSHQRLPHALLPTKIKLLLIAACLMGSMQLLVGCDSPQTSIDDNGATRSDDNLKINTNLSSNGSDSTETIDLDGTETNNPIAEKESTSAAIMPDNQTVSTTGYQGLDFGQAITPKVLTDFGLNKGNSDNEQCYYVSAINERGIDQATDKRTAVLYQIIDGKVALIRIQDANTPFYTGIHVGDTAAEVMSAHHENLHYTIDKYAVDGDYYNLIANVNFEVVDGYQSDAPLTEKKIKLDNQGETLPLQIKYHFKGGKKLNSNSVSEKEWSADDKSALQGEVERIDIGIPEAIYLVEGCS
ncbi:hypothetical protein [Psychrobacter proteolyticus]|uniref:hypothetical protein n=1 Tax=Psychrobacter proteolyticus TaxID=147825 RepID=UPI000E0C1DFB|nr:hypothetical protein [Psychrobacter proteolyticus]